MKKFLLSVIAIVAMSVNALAQEIHVPDDLNGWYAGYYVVTAVDVETLKNGVDSFCTFDGLGGDTWTESQQASLERTCHWGDEDDPISYFGLVKNQKLLCLKGKPKGRFFWFAFGICMVRIRYADQKNRPFGLTNRLHHASPAHIAPRPRPITSPFARFFII